MTDMVQRLDEYGKGAWIAVMVLGFVLFWPAGLAILAYLIWSGRMSCGSSGRCGGSSGARSMWQSRFKDDFGRARSRVEDEFKSFTSTYSSGNKAFDEYRAETLKRLEQEERDFRSFLEKLRQAKDKIEFEQFMDDRRNAPSNGKPESEPPAS
ncbi:MAG: DUF2852 domain-containing protein [Hyphomicrobium sp.]